MIIFDLVRLACWSLRCWLCAFHSPGALIDVWYNGCTRFVEILSCLTPYSTVFAQGLGLHTMIIVIWSVLHAGPWGVGCVLLFHSPGALIDVWYNGCTRFVEILSCLGPYSTVFAQGLELHTMIMVIWSVLHAGPWGVGCVLLFHSAGTSIDVWYNGCTSFCGDTFMPGPYSTVFAQGLEYIP